MTHVYDPATAINDPNGITWGMHPIAWRNDDIPEVGEWNTIDVMFDDLAEAGFAGTEVAGWYPSKEETKEKADAAGLKIVAQWFSSFIVRVVVSEQTGSVQGIRDICIFENKPVLKDEEWPVLAEGLNKLGEIAHEYGLDLVYHHHLGTVVQTKDETLRMLELTDPEKVSLLFDTGHAFVGDGDVMGLLRGAIERIKHVHFKDVRPAKMEESRAAKRSFLDSFLAGMFTVPGDGTIDFTEPYTFLVEHGYKDWILVEAEQDPKIAPPLEYAHIARDYVKGTLLGQ